MDSIQWAALQVKINEIHHKTDEIHNRMTLIYFVSICWILDLIVTYFR